jgi:tRNA/rRNA methyltransferase
MQVSFILVEPAVPENVGSAARAMKTMGFSDLVLVNPCNHLSDPARWLAHASNDILENARVFDKLEDALEDVDFSVSTTTKKRSVKFDYCTLPELPGLLQAKGTSVEKTAVVFGREESGLKNSEMKLCDFVSTVHRAHQPFGRNRHHPPSLFL